MKHNNHKQTQELKQLQHKSNRRSIIIQTRRKTDTKTQKKIQMQTKDTKTTESWNRPQICRTAEPVGSCGFLWSRCVFPSGSSENIKQKQLNSWFRLHDYLHWLTLINEVISRLLTVWTEILHRYEALKHFNVWSFMTKHWRHEINNKCKSLLFCEIMNVCRRIHR